MPSISIGTPWALVGLLVAVVIAVSIFRSHYPQSRGRRLITLFTRALAVALVVLAIADLRLVWPTDNLAVGLVVDSSESIAPEERATLRGQLPALQQDAVIAEAQPFGSDARSPDLAGQIQTAVATLPRDRVHRVLLATDARDPGQDVRASIDAARQRGVEVSILPIGSDPPVDQIAVGDVEVPRLVRAGETLDVGVTLFSAREVDAKLRIAVGPGEPTEAEVRATPGHSAHRVELTFPEQEGVYALTVAGEAAGDRIDENNRHRTMVRVLTRPRVLLINEVNASTPVLSTVLEDAHFRVDRATVADAPTSLGALDPYGLVIIDEVKLTNLSEERQQTIRNYVEQLGGGLVIVSGQNAIRRNPVILREIEPVRRPPAIPEPRPLELVLAIDRSSSMDGRPISQARAAGIAAVNALRSDARVGTVAFSGGADHVMAPTGVDEAGDAAEDFIGRITAGGGTNIAAALSSAGGIMSDDPRYIHHVILLSDGHSDEGPALAAASAVASRGISISTITLGDYSPLMAQIASIGRGRYHVTRNPGSLPAIFVREAQYRQPPAHRQVSFRPSVVTTHRMVRDLDFAAGPPLLGHALASIKPGADTILSSSDRGPLLAHWHQGLGQVATFTSASTGGWANEWRGWEGFRTLWSQVAWSMLRTRTVDPIELRTDPVFRNPGMQRVTVLAPSLDAEVGPEVLLYRAPTDPGEALELEPVGPGVFQALVHVDEGFLVTGRQLSDPEPTAAVAADASYPAELRTFGVDEVMAQAWADVGGGSVLETPAEILANVESERVGRSMRLWLLLAALGLYLLGILLLRLPERAAAIARPENRRGQFERSSKNRGSRAGSHRKDPGENPGKETAA
ncbi:MAG: VWA domain-containing protein [Myxococcota bacterium]